MVRGLVELHDADGRRAQRAFLVEGVRLVAEALSASWPLGAVLYDEARAREDEVLSRLVARMPGAIPATERALRRAADTVSPQGIVAAARMPEPPLELEQTEQLVVILDRVADPGNAGTLLRSAVGAGVRTVIATRGSVDLFSPKVVRAGMGAHFHLRLVVDTGWEALHGLLGPERTVVLADMRASTPYYRHDWRRPSALVVGGEARGPSPEAEGVATARVAVPVATELESLNAAVAGSIIMFEAKRQRDEG